jgi:hypothetical protein
MSPLQIPAYPANDGSWILDWQTMHDSYGNLKIEKQDLQSTKQYIFTQWKGSSYSLQVPEQMSYGLALKVRHAKQALPT